MKKLLALLLAAAMLLSLCACGSSSKPKELEDISDEDWEAAAEALEDMYEEEPTVETEPAEKIYKMGEIIHIEIGDGVAEFVLDSFSFETTADWGNDIPASESDGTSNLTTAESGNTFLFATGTFNYLSEVKRQTTILISADIEYKDGYMFDSTDLGIHGYKETSESNPFADQRATFEPLTDTYTREVRLYAEVPEVIETDTESPLLLHFLLNRGDMLFAEFTVQVR